MMNNYWNSIRMSALVSLGSESKEEEEEKTFDEKKINCHIARII